MRLPTLFVATFTAGQPNFPWYARFTAGFTRTRPFEFMTSRTLDLHDFETTKPLETILIESLIPAIHSSACLLIDAIKPDGTLNHFAYEYLGQVNAQHDAYEPFLGGELLADVAIYYDKNSMYDPAENGLHGVAKLTQVVPTVAPRTPTSRRPTLPI